MDPFLQNNNISKEISQINIEKYSQEEEDHWILIEDQSDSNSPLAYPQENIQQNNLENLIEENPTIIDDNPTIIDEYDDSLQQKILENNKEIQGETLTSNPIFFLNPNSIQEQPNDLQKEHESDEQMILQPLNQSNLQISFIFGESHRNSNNKNNNSKLQAEENTFLDQSYYYISQSKENNNLVSENDTSKNFVTKTSCDEQNVKNDSPFSQSNQGLNSNQIERIEIQQGSLISNDIEQTIIQHSNILIEKKLPLQSNLHQIEQTMILPSLIQNEQQTKIQPANIEVEQTLIQASQIEEQKVNQQNNFSNEKKNQVEGKQHPLILKPSLHQQILKNYTKKGLNFFQDPLLIYDTNNPHFEEFKQYPQKLIQIQCLFTSNNIIASCKVRGDGNCFFRSFISGYILTKIGLFKSGNHEKKNLKSFFYGLLEIPLLTPTFQKECLGDIYSQKDIEEFVKENLMKLFQYVVSSDNSIQATVSQLNSPGIDFSLQILSKSLLLDAARQAISQKVSPLYETLSIQDLEESISQLNRVNGDEQLYPLISSFFNCKLQVFRWQKTGEFDLIRFEPSPGFANSFLKFEMNEGQLTQFGLWYKLGHYYLLITNQQSQLLF